MCPCKKLLKATDDYLKECTWKDLALIKLCLCFIGIMIGLSLPKKAKKPVIILSILAFLVTYIPLMMKFLPFLTKKCGSCNN